MKFSDFYVWAMDAKRTMGVYFAAYVFVYLFLGLFCGVAALPNLVALEMLLCSMAVGFAQAILVPEEKITPARCALWTCGSALLTTACALILGWFRGFPAWCAAVFCIFLALGFAAMWLGLIFKARRETQVLNQGLKNYTRAEKSGNGKAGHARPVHPLNGRHRPAGHSLRAEPDFQDAPGDRGARPGFEELHKRQITPARCAPSERAAVPC